MTNREGSQPIDRVAAWLAILVLTLYLVLVGGGFPGIYTPQLRLASVLLSGLVLVTWAVVAWRDAFWRPRSAIWPAFAVALAAFAVATVTSTIPRMSLEYLGYGILLAALYLLLQRLLAHPFFRPRLGILAVALAGGIALIYLVLVVHDWIGWWALVGRITAPPLRPNFEALTYGNPSAVMTITLLFLAPAVAHVGWATPARRAVVAILGVLVLAVTLASGSRAGWLGLAIAIVVTALAWLALSANRATVGVLLRSRRTRVTLVVLGVPLLAVAAVFAPGFLLRATSGGESVRLAFYVASVRMFLASPITGLGLGSWPIRRMEYTAAGEQDYYIPHAHNLYLETAAEIGLVGIAAGIVVLAILGWLIRGGLPDANRERRRYAWAALFSTFYFGAHQLLDFYPNFPAVLFAFALPIAWLDATSERTVPLPGWLRRSLPRPGRFAGLAAVAVLTVAVAGHAWSETNAIAHQDAVDAANAGDWARALPLARAAATADPGIPAYQFTLGLAEAHAGDTAAAADAFRRSATADDLPPAWLDLAAEELALGDRAPARDALGRAMRLGEQHPVVAVGAGTLYLELGEPDAARDAFAAALIDDPSLAGDPWWSAAPDRAALFPSVVDEAIARADPPIAFQVAMLSGRDDAAQRIAGTFAPGDRDVDLLLVRAWGGDEEALRELAARAKASPLDFTLVGWCARVTAHRGEQDAALRCGVPAGGVPGELRVATAEGGPLTIAGELTGFYGQYTYRRAVPWDQVVPGLPRLAYP